MKILYNINKIIKYFIVVMFVVRFSDKIEFNFTEYQIKLLPYFKTLLESDFKTDFQISQASTWFDYLHIYATLDELDITDLQNKYLFVLKQCDFFCYDKLKELIERKYGFRKMLIQLNNEIKQYEKEYNELWDINPNSEDIIEYIMDDINELIKSILDDTKFTNFRSIIISKLEEFLDNYYDDAPNDYNFYIKLPNIDGEYLKFVNSYEYKKYYYEKFKDQYESVPDFDKYFIYVLPDILMNLIKNYKQIILESDIIDKRIDELFENDIKYKLVRFESLKSELLKYINNKIIEICTIKFETFLHSIENHIIFTLTKSNITDKPSCLSDLITTINKLYKIQIIYPLYYRFIEFEHECIESDEYKERRNKLSQSIIATKDRMNEIEKSNINY